MNYDINDINSFKDVDFYGLRGTDFGFYTLHDCIITFDKRDQLFFNSFVFHGYNSSVRQIEDNILREITNDIEEHLDTFVLHQLVKISTCTHWLSKYQDLEKSKITGLIGRTEGKWYFQPDQRCAGVERLVKARPLIACSIIPYAEMIFN